MTLPNGVGPHTDRELTLMLKGSKPCAVFHDIVPDDADIPEAIIPEHAFRPYVEKADILRFSKDFKNAKSGRIYRVVCFTLPNEAWRASFLFWLKARLHAGIKSDDADDILEGRILGYDEADIQTYLKHKHSSR